MNFKRKKSRKQTVGCACCHILKNNSSTRTKPKDREVVERVRTRSKRPRPFVIEHRAKIDRQWSVWKKYRTAAERDKAFATLTRINVWSDWRIPA